MTPSAFLQQAETGSDGLVVLFRILSLRTRIFSNCPFSFQNFKIEFLLKVTEKGVDIGCNSELCLVPLSKYIELPKNGK